MPTIFDGGVRTEVTVFTLRAFDDDCFHFSPLVPIIRSELGVLETLHAHLDGRFEVRHLEYAERHLPFVNMAVFHHLGDCFQILHQSLFRIVMQSSIEAAFAKSR